MNSYILCITMFKMIQNCIQMNKQTKKSPRLSLSSNAVCYGPLCNHEAVKKIPHIRHVLPLFVLNTIQLQFM